MRLFVCEYFAPTGVLAVVRRTRVRTVESIPIFILVVLLLAFPAVVRADYTATVNPNSVLVTNFQGWGSSLCWWANVVGNYPNRTNFVDLAFNKLGLNIVRYNIGAGQNPSISTPKQGYRTIMQGFEPTNGIWNWNADANQRWVLKAALARGADLVDAFANSPPWWMCVNSNVDGGTSGTNNLQAACETPYTAYLATVVSNLTVLDGVHFDFATPMNEPSISWNYTNQSQEGCHMTSDQQGRVVNDLRAALNTSAPAIGVVAPSDYDEYEAYNDLVAYSSTTLANLAMFTTHTYKANDAASLSSEATSQKKPLWVSEYGDSDASGLTMAQRIHDDVTGMKVRGWVYWQLVDSAGGWGLLYNPLAATNGSGFTTNYTVNQKYYVMGQFSEFVRPGCKIVSVNDANTVAAYNPTNSTLVLVTANTNSTGFNVTYNLSSFGAVPWQVSVVQTAAGETLTRLASPIVTGQQFTSAIPALSVTTFVLTTNTYAPTIVAQYPATYTNVFNLYPGQVPAFSLSVTGSVPLSYQWKSNGVPVAGATNSGFTPASLSTSGATSFLCIVTNAFGSATTAVWSASVIPAPTAPYPRAVLALDPAGYWRLNETGPGSGNNGVIAVDYAGGNNGIYTNVALGQPGYNTTNEPAQTSVRFSYLPGQNNSCVMGITGPDFALPGGSTAKFTVAAWVNSAGANGLNTPTVAAKGYYFQEEYALDAGAPNSSFRFSVRNAAGTAYNANSTLPLSSSGRWYHLVGVCDEAGGLVSLYTNGVLAASAALPAASGIVNSSQTPMTIGSRSSQPANGFDQQFPGYISDVAVFNYALTAAQVQTLYQAGVSLPPSGLTLTNLPGNLLKLNWNYGILQVATNTTGPYTDLTNVVQPYTAPATNTLQFFRVREN